MTQEAIVYSASGRSAVVEVSRKSACGGDCGSCKGCHHPEQVIRVTVRNDVEARAGDRVVIESSGRKVFRSAAVAYILPLILMVAFYFLGSSEGARIALSFLGLGCGVLLCWLYARFVVGKETYRAAIREILR